MFNVAEGIGALHNNDVLTTQRAVGLAARHNAKRCCLVVSSFIANQRSKLIDTVFEKSRMRKRRTRDC